MDLETIRKSLELHTLENAFLKEIIFKIKMLLDVNPEVMSDEEILNAIAGLLKTLDLDAKFWHPDGYEL